ncbi:hypothetical protein DFH08DRAFT_825415 [Mycena albidolilacea]|uniref:Uncharacterized protein n=1 Tax=Mycena albidolilacea TaxID=1033008 RepID=A0AAD6Z2J3_9AGAR|nr:hypothetical protein DFH08DRAFT_825415 [Mycena albidolilacea]
MTHGSQLISQLQDQTLGHHQSSVLASPFRIFGGGFEMLQDSEDIHGVGELIRGQMKLHRIFKNLMILAKDLPHSGWKMVWQFPGMGRGRFILDDLGESLPESSYLREAVYTHLPKMESMGTLQPYKSDPNMPAEPDMGQRWLQQWVNIERPVDPPSHLLKLAQREPTMSSPPSSTFHGKGSPFRSHSQSSTTM